MHSYGFGTVAKVNGYGHVLIDPESPDAAGRITFDKYGEERGRKYGGRCLITAANLEARLAEVKAKRDAYAAAKAIITELESHKNGRGDFCISAETKAKLAELVAALPVNYTPG